MKNIKKKGLTEIIGNTLFYTGGYGMIANVATIYIPRAVEFRQMSAPFRKTAYLVSLGAFLVGGGISAYKEARRDKAEKELREYNS